MLECEARAAAAKEEQYLTVTAASVKINVEQIFKLMSPGTEVKAI